MSTCIFFGCPSQTVAGLIVCARHRNKAVGITPETNPKTPAEEVPDHPSVAEIAGLRQDLAASQKGRDYWARKAEEARDERDGARARIARVAAAHEASRHEVGKLSARLDVRDAEIARLTAELKAAQPPKPEPAPHPAPEVGMVLRIGNGWNVEDVELCEGADGPALTVSLRSIGWPLTTMKMDGGAWAALDPANIERPKPAWKAPEPKLGMVILYGGVRRYVFHIGPARQVMLSGWIEISSDAWDALPESAFTPTPTAG